MVIDILEFNPEKIDKMLTAGKKIGYWGFIIHIEKSDLAKTVQKISTESKIPAVPLIEIDKYGTALSRDTYVIVGAEATNETEFRKSLRNPKISLITIDPNDMAKIINKQTINIAKQYYKFIEIPIKPLLYAQPTERHKILTTIRNTLRLISNKKIRIIFTTRATNIYEMITPRQLRAVLLEIGFKDITIKKILKQNPLELIITPYEITTIKDKNTLKVLEKILELGRRAGLEPAT